MAETTIERIVGNNGKDVEQSTSANESFDLKRGFDLITVDISKTGNYQNFGEDIINLTQGENLTVLVKISSIANYSYNNSHNFFTTSIKGMLTSSRSACYTRMTNTLLSSPILYTD